VQTDPCELAETHRALVDGIRQLDTDDRLVERLDIGDDLLVCFRMNKGVEVLVGDDPLPRDAASRRGRH
jgi:hypothetical protein